MPSSSDAATSSSTDQQHRLEKALQQIQDHSDLFAATIVALGFVWRLWRANATFFNTDEAWHYFLANQNSLAAAYKASLTISHPPLLVFVLYYWRHLGTSNLVLRLPSVIAGTALCFAIYKWLSRVFGQGIAWLGLIFMTFLPPMIALSAELRQYTLMMLFAVCSAILLEEALARNSTWQMLGSSLCLYLAMLSHYSAFLFAAALGIYAIVRMIGERPRTAVSAAWMSGQSAGVGLAGFLYVTQISQMGRVYTGAQPLHNYADWYLSDWYFHPGRDRLLPFLSRNTFGVFRFTFGQTAVGQIAVVLFIAGVVLVAVQQPRSWRLPARSTAVLLLSPFALSWVAVIVGLYPYGRTRQCIFLALFAIAGFSVALWMISGARAVVGGLLAVSTVIACHAFGTLQGRDMLPLADQRHEHMDQLMQFIRSNVGPDDVIFTDQATSFQLRHYLCNQKPVRTEISPEGFEDFRCEGFQVLFTGADDGALTAQSMDTRRHDNQWLTLEANAVHVWVVQGGWATGLGDEIRRIPWYTSHIEVHSFGRYLEIFQLPSPRIYPVQG